MTQLGILGSTRGTSLQAIIDAIQQQKLKATIQTVISNKQDAYLLERSRQQGLHAEFIDPTGLTREAYDRKVSASLMAHSVELIVLIGYMRILSSEFVKQWQHKIINVHPSLLPDFAGKMSDDVHRSVLAAGVKETGCTVHQVIEEVDAGPILVQRRCAVQEGDTIESLKQRVQALEGEALIAAIMQLRKM